MASYLPREEKQADDGSRVRLLQDKNDASWFVGRVGDPHLDPIPLGGFPSEDAARRWADAQFHGGSWTPVTTPPPKRGPPRSA